MSERQANEVDVFIGQRVREAREASSLSQEQLGARLGVSHQMIDKFEKGRSRLAARQLMQVAAATGKHTDLGWFQPPVKSLKGATKS